MKVIKFILLTVVILIGAVLLITAIMPKEYKVQESIEISKPADEIYDYVSNLKNWESFSPWAERDNTLVNEYSGPESGVGSKMSWKGEVTGVGSLTISEADPGKSITTDLVFVEPFEASSNGFWKFEENEGNTKVTWGNYGKNKWPMEVIFMKLFGFKEISKDFNNGLANLKEVMESMPDKPSYSMSEFRISEVEPIAMYSITETMKMSDMEAKMGDHYGALMKHIMDNGQEMSDAPLAVYYEWNVEDGVTKVECGVPVAEPKKGNGMIEVSQTPGGKVVWVSYIGAYDNLGVAHEAMDTYIRSNNLEVTGPVWERYVGDPTEVEEEELETIIYYPVKERS
ncbi:MAG: hypothetical protein HKN92_02885 [Chitinophagales bacterium]|nr:hypothetical protein [Chitinophagales bacterium]